MATYVYDPAPMMPALRSALLLLAEDFPIRPVEPGEKPNIRLRFAATGPAFHFESGQPVVSGKTLPMVLRALALLHACQLAGKTPRRYEERPRFQTVGLMLDVSRNAVYRPQAVQHLLRRMALMGYNLFMLYAEDTYQVPGEPWFGYMRGRYGLDELGKLDVYAHRLGIEMIPCIQTLGHLAQPLRWDRFAPVRDTADILLVDEPQTYQLLDRLLDAATAPFRSKRIHVGMDEAHAIGQGRYRQQFGERPGHEIMLRHLRRLDDMIAARGLRPMMWSDMWFRLGSRTGNYYDLQADIPAAVAKQIPQSMELVYWDYYHPDPETYAAMIAKHRQMGKEPIFAGGVWSYQVMWTNYDRTFAFTRAAMKACRAEKVKEAFTTVWGDDGVEADMRTALPALQVFADEAYSDGSDDAAAARHFRASCGGNLDNWRLGTLLDWTPGQATMRQIAETFDQPIPKSAAHLADLDANLEVGNTAKYALWQDPLLGLFDAHIDGHGLGEHYGQLGQRMQQALREHPEDKVVLERGLLLAQALELKAEIGIRLRQAYRNKNLAALKHLRDKVLPEAIRRVEAVHACHRAQWLSQCKPQGWEALEVRYAGVIARLRTAVLRIDQHLGGQAPRLEELDEDRLPLMQWPPGRIGHSGIGYRRMAFATLIQ